MVLAELGPMKASEKGLIVVSHFLQSLVGFYRPFGIKIDATAVAIVAMIATFCMLALFLGMICLKLKLLGTH